MKNKIKNYITPFILVSNENIFEKWSRNRQYFESEYSKLLSMFEDEQGLLARNVILDRSEYVLFSCYDFLLIDEVEDKLRITTSLFDSSKSYDGIDLNFFSSSQLIYVFEPWMNECPIGFNKSTSNQDSYDSLVLKNTYAQFRIIKQDGKEVGLEFISDSVKPL